MAELINKKDAIEQIKSIPCVTLEEFSCKELAESKIKRMPITTEAEIRAKAIDEFLEYLKEIESISAKCTCSQSDGYSQIMRICESIAEQLKEE